MLIKIDSAVRRFGLANLVAVRGETRRYYAADAPHLMIVVTHQNLVLGDLPGRVVDAAIGWHDGKYGFVRPGNEDKRHSKLTIFSVVERGKGEPKFDETLAQVLADAPKEG